MPLHVVDVAASVVAVAASVVCAVDGLSDFPNFCTLASEFCFPQPLSKAAAAAAHNGHVKRHMEPKLESQSQQALHRGQKGAWLLPKVVALTIRAFQGFFSICGLCFSAIASASLLHCPSALQLSILDRRMAFYLAVLARKRRATFGLSFIQKGGRGRGSPARGPQIYALKLPDELSHLINFIALQQS